MWQLIKSHPWTAAVGALILLGAVVGVIIGIITKGGWKDRGLMQRGGQKLRWPHAALPLPVLVHANVPELCYEALFTVTRFINDRTKLALFMLPSRLSVPIEPELAKVPGGQCIIFMGTDPTKGTTEHRFDLRTGFVTAAMVHLPPDLEEAKRTPVILHEMLHVLCLDHDDQPTGSVMGPQLNTAGILTELDVRVLLETYKQS